MNRSILQFSYTVLLGTVLIYFACNKSEEKSPSSFTWTVSGNTHIATLDSAYVQYDLTPYLIQGITGTNFNTSYNRKLYFSLSSFNPGTYTIITGNTGSNIMAYIDELGFNHYGVSGTLTITSYSNNLLNGNFSCII